VTAHDKPLTDLTEEALRVLYHEVGTVNYMFYVIQTCDQYSPSYIVSRIPLLDVGEAIRIAGIDAWYRRSNPMNDLWTSLMRSRRLIP
jgi:hypothetical protein